MSFLYFIEIDGIFVETNFIALFVFFDELFEVGARVASLLFAGIEDDHFLG